MQEEEFRSWLLAKGRTTKAVSTRISRLRKLESSLAAIKAPQMTLDDAYSADKLQGLIEHLGVMRVAARQGDRTFVVLSDTANSDGYLSAQRSYLGLYRRFRDGELARSASSDWPELEAMREVFLERMPDFRDFQHRNDDYWLIEREYKDRILSSVAEKRNSISDDATLGRAVHDALQPQNGPPLRWQTRHAVEQQAPELVEKFYAIIGSLARVPARQSSEPFLGTAEIAQAAEALEALQREGAKSLTPGEIRCITHSVRGAAYPLESCFTKVGKGDLLGRRLLGRSVFNSSPSDPKEVMEWQRLLHRIFVVMRDEWRWQPHDLLDVQGFAWVALDPEFEVSDEDVESSTAPIVLYDANGGQFIPVPMSPREGGEPTYRVSLGGNTRDATEDVTDLTTVAKALLIDGRLVRIAPKAGGTPNLLGYAKQKLVGYRVSRAIADALGIASEGGVLPAGNVMPTDQVEAKSTMPENTAAYPGNIILYGPPGTGKTFATARHAVALIEGDEWLSDSRRSIEEIRARYRELVAAKQIEFVTFHQSYAYEDFVEGLRPMLGTDEEETLEPEEGKRTPMGGFGLRPVPGVFHRISTRAERARLAAHDPIDRSHQPFELGKRRVFKMSIGRAGSEDHMFDAAIAGGYTALGWGREEDWSDPKYRIYDEVYKRANEIKPGTSGNAGDIAQVWRFREMDEGDVIVVSQGNYLVRAIGIITSDYYYDPDDSQNYEHRRKVDWRVVPNEPIPVGEIYGTSFTQASCYQLKPERLNRPALERLLAEGQRTLANPIDENGPVISTDRPNQFVLIIDEINRANISKVFGELITLLEPDKRLGQDNALTVTLPYSGKSFGIPDNLHVLGTMNTADRSIALLDTALRRRFEFRELMPDPSLLPEELDSVPLRRLLTTLNERIEYLFDREHQIGHAFFIHCANRADIDVVMRRKVLPLLAEYFYEDWSRIAVVLGDTEGKRFLAKVSLPTPPGLSDDGVNEVRIRWTVRESFSLDAYDDLA